MEGIYSYGHAPLARANLLTGQVLALAPDGLGSVRLLVDADTRQVLDTYRYAPFGAVLAGGTSNNTRRFTGETQDPTGLIYLRARYYDPATGRFLTRDPFPGLAALPQTQHPYVCVGNNPVNLTDPGGRFVNVIVGVAAGGLVGAGAYAISVTMSGQQFSTRDMLIVAGTGAVAGGLIGSGVGIRAMVGTGAGSSALGYLAANAWTGSAFCIKDFAVGVGALSGALTPVVGTSLPGIMGLEATANVAQYWLTELTSGRRPTAGGTIWSASTGMAAGWIGGPYTAVDIGFDLTSPWLDQQVLRMMLQDQIFRTTVREFPRSMLASIASNLPDPVLVLDLLKETVR